MDRNASNPVDIDANFNFIFTLVLHLHEITLSLVTHLDRKIPTVVYTFCLLHNTLCNTWITVAHEMYPVVHYIPPNRRRTSYYLLLKKPTERWTAKVHIRTLACWSAMLIAPFQKKSVYAVLAKGARFRCRTWWWWWWWPPQYTECGFGLTSGWLRGT